VANLDAMFSVIIISPANILLSLIFISLSCKTPVHPVSAGFFDLDIICCVDIIMCWGFESYALSD